MGVLVSRSLPLRVSEAVSDEELVRRALAGERWGREMLYRRHAGNLLSITVRLLANRGEAEEIVQETFVTAFEQLGTLRKPVAVRGWLGQITVNLVRRQFRRGRLLRFLGLGRAADDATSEALADPGISTVQGAEEALARVWRGIGARATGGRVRPRVWAVASVVTVAGLAIAFASLERRDRGSLRFADGRPLGAVEAPPVGAELALSDGSRVDLAPGARFAPLESTGTSFVAVLERGSAHFEVRPGGPRRWQIECGLATVEVVGTGFDCLRAPGRLSVSVRHGAALVRGERVPDRARRLAAGETLEVLEP